MKKTLRDALSMTFPVMVGYIFLGITFGILCAEKGYSPMWAVFISFVVYAGSMQFVLLSFFHSGYHLLEIAFVTLSVNARQIFYGLSFLKSFESMGKKKWYMIFALTDETYSLLCNVKEKEEPKGKKLMFCIAFLDQLYWVLGSFIGGVVGSLLSFSTTGIDFMMTALFTVLFVEQWLSSKSYATLYCAITGSILSILLFRLENFLMPALCFTAVFLLLFESKIEKEES